ncbi:MAG: phospholipase D-like domain-containing protein [Pseudomonadota bacterium]
MFDAGHAYSTMLAAINSANHSVLLSQYIFESRGIGWQFIDALGNAARRGVEVHVILDKVGALYSIGSTRRQLQRVGVRVAMFLPAKLRVFGWRFNLRNHRKILVVDDQLAFTGGMNIRNGYLRKRPRKAPDIRDTHFRCEGPVANDLAAIFRDDWRYATGEILPAFAEPRETDGNVNCRTTIDGPDNNVDLLTITLLAAIATAQQRVRITMPYFLPPRELMSGLQAAAIRGVRVDVLIPQNNNLRVVDWAMQHTFRELLRYGIGVYKQVGPFDHSKLITIDNDRCVFGSVNIDHRSLRLNFELAIEAWNPHLTATLNEYIERQIETADILDLESTQRQPRWMKLRNAIAWLGSPYL